MYLPFRVPHSRGKNHQRLLVHREKVFVMLLDRSRARDLRVLSMKPFHLFLRVPHALAGFPRIFILRAAFPFHKVRKLFHRFIPSSDLSRVGNDLTVDDPVYLPF